MPPRLDHILIGVDFSPDALAVARLATRIARAQDAGVTLFYAAPLFVHARIPPAVAYEIARESAARSTEQLRSVAAELEADNTGVDLDVAVTAGEPYREFLQAVDTRDVDLVAIGSRGRDADGADRLGGLTARLLRSAQVPVLTAHAGQEPRFPDSGLFETPLVAIDYSSFALPCAHWASQLAAPRRPIQLLHAMWTANMEDPRLAEHLGQVRSEELERLSALANATEVAPTVAHVSLGPRSVRDQIIAFAGESSTDLVVLGAEGSGSGLGSVATGLARRSPVPTLIVTGRALAGR